jgi:signal transduction histidine kinase
VGTLLYIRLIGFTAGTLLMLFWMVVILGYRRQRNFERVFFFLCLALFLFYGGSLLAVNGEIYYAHLPPALTQFVWTVLITGLSFAPALLWHLHLEYASTRTKAPPPAFRLLKIASLVIVYLLVGYFLLRALPRWIAPYGDFLIPAQLLGVTYGFYLAGILAACALLQFLFGRKTTEPAERNYHTFSAIVLGLGSILTISVHVVFRASSFGDITGGTDLSLLPIFPFAALIYAVEKHNFLQIGRQTNLMYAISITFLALLYLSLVRRVGTFLEPILPPEATAAILLFVLVIFIEPMQRALGRRLHKTAQLELDAIRPLIARIREKSREGNLRGLVQFVGDSVEQRFEFAEAWLEVRQPLLAESIRDSSQNTGAEEFSANQAGSVNAVLWVRPHGAMLSGETRAALEALCEQLPGSIDLCRLIDEKLSLERELAERERMAALGQMAASISHNLKNPLGSIKTILQVQMESPEMPESLKAETRMVLNEVSRLANKLGQLLQFSRPTVLGETGAAFDLASVATEIGEVMRPEAERKGITLKVASESGLQVNASREAVSDILSNLVVNALDAVDAGGQIAVNVVRRDGSALICVQDDGKGIPTELREKVMQPFFTTKTQGTGLGLAIVARRTSEAGGRLELQSPAPNELGTRFSVWLPLRDVKTTVGRTERP